MVAISSWHHQVIADLPRCQASHGINVAVIFATIPLRSSSGTQGTSKSCTSNFEVQELLIVPYNCTPLGTPYRNKKGFSFTGVDLTWSLHCIFIILEVCWRYKRKYQSSFLSTLSNHNKKECQNYSGCLLIHGEGKLYAGQRKLRGSLIESRGKGVAVGWYSAEEKH